LLLRCVQLECARILLFRGANKNVLNRTMFDAHRVASMQHKRIAELIEGFQDKDVGNVVLRLLARRRITVTLMSLFVNAKHLPLPSATRSLAVAKRPCDCCKN